MKRAGNRLLFLILRHCEPDAFRVKQSPMTLRETASQKDARSDVLLRLINNLPTKDRHRRLCLTDLQRRDLKNIPIQHDQICQFSGG